MHPNESLLKLPAFELAGSIARRGNNNVLCHLRIMFPALCKRSWMRFPPRAPSIWPRTTHTQTALQSRNSNASKCISIHAHTYTYISTYMQCADGKDDDKGRKLPTLLTTSALDCCLLIFHHISVYAMHTPSPKGGEEAQDGVPNLLGLNIHMQQVLGVVCAWYGHRKPLLVEGVNVVMGTLDACARAGSQVRASVCLSVSTDEIHTVYTKRCWWVHACMHTYIYTYIPRYMHACIHT